MKVESGLFKTARGLEHVELMDGFGLKDLIGTQQEINGNQKDLNGCFQKRRPDFGGRGQ